MNKEFKWDDDLVREFALQVKITGAKEWIDPQIIAFKASHTEVKGVDWEIVAAEKNGWVHKWNDFYAHHTNDCSKVGCNIHSVKRLSDGEVFSVGDSVDYVLGNFTIEKFEIKPAYGMSRQIWVSGGIVTITSHPEHGEFKNIRKPLQRTPLPPIPSDNLRIQWLEDRVAYIEKILKIDQ